MTVWTSRGKAFPADWTWGPVGPREELRLQIRDPRPLRDIAADFEGLEGLRRVSDLEGNRDYPGYGVLAGLTRPPRGPEDAAQLTLRKGEATP